MKTEDRVHQFKTKVEEIRSEISKVIVGQKNVIEEVLIALIAGGNVLLEGVPGLGKTLLVKTLGEILGLSFSRIQFTPDLMPADITGTHIVIDGQRRHFEFQKGPIFANLILADEINRATPKTQSALLEAMQEKSVTSLGTVYSLPNPFMVLATQNPIEMEGTYPLPEAQVDRFFFKIQVNFPTKAEMEAILKRTTGSKMPQVEKKIGREELLEIMNLAREVLISDAVNEYICSLVLATHPEIEDSPEISKKYIRYGASPRGAQVLVLGGKVKALMDGRFNVSFSDVESISLPALRHRILLNFEAQAEGISTDEIVKELLKEVSYDKIPQKS